MAVRIDHTTMEAIARAQAEETAAKAKGRVIPLPVPEPKNIEEGLSFDDVIGMSVSGKGKAKKNTRKKK